jgi:hypothetical protein
MIVLHGVGFEISSEDTELRLLRNLDHGENSAFPGCSAE